MRTYLSGPAVLFSLLLPLQALADSAAPATPVAPTAPAGPAALAAPAAPAAREQIPEALSAKVRGKKLVAREQPLAVGAVAPRFAALARVPTAIVFYRGHW